ncbi:putative phospholipid import ATP-binding protein MlaF [Planctomycetes bacterium Poly30]|uniref:Putative phospholipid import ATP-binding protein MlaF n=1 Tax=Saltatorellus ferox TaxID=2528018 RepID=A0A518EPC6_9BACT|nr:putative phospholipid import ATP-binding protein MlaF [Planctomycetes bacterium Poly30]
MGAPEILSSRGGSLPGFIHARELSIGYGKPLMENLDFTIGKGEVFLILGGSGTGKSTLLKTLFGRLAPLAGSVEIAGVGDPARLQGHRPRFGVSFQGGALFGSLTIAQNVALPLEQWTSLDARTIAGIVDGKLRLVGLEGAGDRLPSELSGGMQKRAGIARALALENDLLFLDEPSAGLDPITSSELDDLLIALNRSLGLTLVIVTHELESIFKIGTRAILLDRKTRGIVADGDPRVLRDESFDPRVRAFFHRESVSGRREAQTDSVQGELLSSTPRPQPAEEPFTKDLPPIVREDPFRGEYL